MRDLSEFSPGLQRFGTAPALSFLILAGAVLDLGINRIAIRALDGLDHESRLQLVRFGELPRNVAALAGLGVLTLALFDLFHLRASGIQRITLGLWKLLVATFAGVICLGGMLAILLPAEHSPGRVVLLSMSAASVLGVLLSLTGARTRAPFSSRFGSGLIATSILFSFAAHVTSRLAMVSGSQMLQTSRPWLMAIGEFSFLLAPLLLGIASVPREATRRAKTAWIVGGIASASVAFLFLRGASGPRTDLLEFLYGTERLSVLFHDHVWLYGIPLSLATGLCVSGLFGPRPYRQGAIAGLLFLCAGCAPSSTSLLINMVAAAAIAMRPSLAMSPLTQTTQPNS